MMKISTKRPFDHLQNTQAPCSPHFISFLDSCALQSIKKRKTELEEEVDSNKNTLPDQDWTIQAGIDTKLIEWIPKPKKELYMTRSPKEKIFSSLDVRVILGKAIEDAKQVLTEEYNHALEQRLAEQFKEFSAFNQDHIHRMMNGNSNYNYMS